MPTTDPREHDGPRPYAIVSRTRYLWGQDGPGCYACEALLEGVDGRECDYQLDNVLWASFSGGYGMFIDAHENATTVALCHDCAHAACEALPWLDRLLQPQRSHAHSIRRDWGDHRGWDLPHRRDDVS